MNITGLAIGWAEAIADTIDYPEARPAGFAEPNYPVSHQVSISQEHGLSIYHVADDQLGQGSSLGAPSSPMIRSPASLYQVSARFSRRGEGCMVSMQGEVDPGLLPA